MLKAELDRLCVPATFGLSNSYWAPCVTRTSFPAVASALSLQSSILLELEAVENFGTFDLGFQELELELDDA